jgi:hypothetical protein
MTARLPVAVAPNFHLPDAPAGRWLVADSTGWRPPSEGERAAMAPPAATPQGLSGAFLLFALPGHLRSSSWTMLEQGAAADRFDAFASEVGRFLTFKGLPPPEGAVFELVLHGAGGKLESRGLWAVVNLGEAPVVVGGPGLRVRLGAGEGGRLPEGVAADVIAPEGDSPDVLLVVRRPERQGCASLAGDHSIARREESHE